MLNSLINFPNCSTRFYVGVDENIFTCDGSSSAYAGDHACALKRNSACRHGVGRGGVHNSRCGHFQRMISCASGDSANSRMTHRSLGACAPKQASAPRGVGGYSFWDKGLARGAPFNQGCSYRNWISSSRGFRWPSGDSSGMPIGSRETARTVSGSLKIF